MAYDCFKKLSTVKKVPLLSFIAGWLPPGLFVEKKNKRSHPTSNRPQLRWSLNFILLNRKNLRRIYLFDLKNYKYWVQYHKIALKSLRR